MKKQKVLVGMSGGIDSTATCLMLQEQGYELVGLTMWVWGDEPIEARQLAERMGIEHHIVDEREAFKQTIVQNFIDEYRAGRTPNPCVLCNPMHKFAQLIRWADRLGCAQIATGHYSRLVEVDGITGATVTSKAIARSVNSAVGFVTGADVSSSATTWGG